MIAAVLLPATSGAYDFRPEPAEWANWPEYCKARYATLDSFKRSAYARTVPSASIAAWRTRLGEDTFNPIHHYCASLVYLQRYYLARTDQDRNYLLHSAQNECQFTLERLPPTSPLYRQVAGHMKMVQSLQIKNRPTSR
jgi:hypothetical protein